METTVSRSPLFDLYPCWQGISKPGMQTDFVGIHTREAFFTEIVEPGGRHLQAPYPPVDEEYFEWISILESVQQAERTFTMIELGAGWGRWLGRAVGAVRNSRPDLECHLVGVEAEPSHFQWMHTHFKDNGLKPRNHWLIEAAVSDEEGWVNFQVGDPSAWYGQAIDSSQPATPPPSLWKRLLHRLIRKTPPTENHVQPIRAITLASILQKYDKVDLIDADIQGSEAMVFEASAELVNERVSRVHIGTHSEEQEERLRRLFTDLGWECEFDFAQNNTQETPYGTVEFQDGVQTWTNPRYRKNPMTD